MVNTFLPAQDGGLYSNRLEGSWPNDNALATGNIPGREEEEMEEYVYAMMVTAAKKIGERFRSGRRSENPPQGFLMQMN